MAPEGGVTASSAAATAAGEQILRAGGNAVDAAVAVALASCVADPCNTGIGGYGGHMIVARPGLKPACVDFNLWAPTDTLHSYSSHALSGPGASAIPNVVAGLSAALDAFGSMSWAQVSAPAIALACDGFMCNATLMQAFEAVKGAAFVDECFRLESVEAREGECRLHVRQPALARTLNQLATNGPQWFYTGPVAAIGSRCLRNAGHAITAAHWADALDAVTIAPAPALRVADVTLSSAPLCTSGSICMFAVMAAGAELAASSELESPDSIAAWAMRIAAAWSYRFGTPTGNDIADDSVEDWIRHAAAHVPTMALGPGLGHTCHLNTSDRDGTLVAATLTHGKQWFGARWTIPDTGIIMNFGGPMVREPEPKFVNRRAFAVTNMSPTIARTDDGAVLAIGSPGARRISTIIGLVLARHLAAGVPLQHAISRGRFHAEGRARATVERDRLPASVVNALRTAFPAVEVEAPASYYGPCTAIRRDADGKITLGLDDRWQGYGAIVT